jgi:hypothetical protein
MGLIGEFRSGNFSLYGQWQVQRISPIFFLVLFDPSAAAAVVLETRMVSYTGLSIAWCLPTATTWKERRQHSSIDNLSEERTCQDRVGIWDTLSLTFGQKDRFKTAHWQLTEGSFDT